MATPMPIPVDREHARRSPLKAGTLLLILLMGGLGGMMPTLIKLAPVYIETQNPEMPAAGLYVGLAIFFLIGAIVAGAFRERDFGKAIMLGIAAPGIVTNYFAGKSAVAPTLPTAAVEQRAVNLNQVVGALLGSGPAHAQKASSSTRAASNPAHLTVVPTVDSGKKSFSVKPVRLEFLDEGGKVLGSNDVNPRVATTLTVPDGSTSVRATTDGQQVATNLPTGAYLTAELALSLQVSRGNDLMWALGGARGGKVDNLLADIANVRREPRVAGAAVVNSKGQQVGVVDSVVTEPGKSAQVVLKE
jgi:hypothetical protein